MHRRSAFRCEVIKAIEISFDKYSEICTRQVVIEMRKF